MFHSHSYPGSPGRVRYRCNRHAYAQCPRNLERRHAQANNAVVVDMAHGESPHKGSTTKELVCNAKAIHKRGSLEL
jgi:hypothetical protein